MDEQYPTEHGEDAANNLTPEVQAQELPRIKITTERMIQGYPIRTKQSTVKIYFNFFK